MTSPNRNNEKCANLKRNGPSFRKVAERVQQWNRAIPESNYITLGTIRYGVRHSPGPLSLGLSASPHSSSLPNEPPSPTTCSTDFATNEYLASSELESERPLRISTATSTNLSVASDTCCCLGPASTIHLPWNPATNQQSVSGSCRTKLPVPTSSCCSAAAKNRTQLSTATQASLNSSSFSLMSLAVSSAPTPTHTSRSQSVLLSSEIAAVGKDDHAVDRQIAERTQTDESCGLGMGAMEEAAALGMRSVVAKAATTATTPNPGSHTEAIPGDRPTHGKRSGCACCQNASRNSSDATNGSVSNISATSSADSAARSTSGEIGCCCEPNSVSSRSVSVGQFCELPTAVPPAPFKSQSDSNLSSSSLTSATVCCYTIADSSKSNPKNGHRGSYQYDSHKRLPRAALQQDIKEKFGQVPPIPPPRPRPKLPGSTTTDRNNETNAKSQPTVTSNNRYSVHRRDPINFRRKLQHFESYQKNGDRRSDDGSNAIGCGGDHLVGTGLELLSCFSGGSLTAEDTTRKANCCSPNHSEISYSGSSSKSEPHLNIASAKHQINNNNSANPNNNVQPPRTDNYHDRPPVLVSRNNSHPTLRKVIVPNLERLFNDPSAPTAKNESNSVFYRKLTPPASKKSLLPYRRDASNRSNGTRRSESLQVLPQHDARVDRSEDRLIPKTNDNRSRLRDEVDEAPSSIGGASERPAINALNCANNDNDRVRATLVEIVDDDDDEDINDSVDNDDEFIDYEVDHDDDVDSEICFIDSSQSDIDLIGSLNGHFSNLSANSHTNGHRVVLSEPILSGTAAAQQFSRPIKLSPFNTNNLFLSDNQVPNSSLVHETSNQTDNVNHSSTLPSSKFHASINTLRNQSHLNSNHSPLRSRSDFEYTTRPSVASDGSVSVSDKYNIPSSFRVASLDESNHNLSYSNSNLNLNSSDLRHTSNGSESYESFIEIHSIPEERIVPRIDRSQSFDSYKRTLPLPLSSSVSGTGNVSSSSGQLASPVTLSSPTSPLPFTCTSGSVSPFSSSLLIYTSQQLPISGGFNSKGPYVVGRRVSSSDSFGNYTKNQLHANTILSSDTGSIMEKRRNTLDRLQRLRFGRKSSPSPTPSQQDKSSASSSSSSSRKSNEKSEVLKELTERLKGNRLSPTPPPIPPPRKPRQTNSLEKPSPSTESSPLGSTVFGSDDIIPMDADDEKSTAVEERKTEEASEIVKDAPTIPSPPPPPPPPPPPMPPLLVSPHPMSLTMLMSGPPKSSLYDTLRPNTSVSNLESLLLRGKSRDDVKSAPTSVVKEEDLFKELPRAESRILVGAYAQKSIPFRSISFSQIDFSSSGKYVRSSLNALRDKWKKDKDKETSVVDKANLILPDKTKENENKEDDTPRSTGAEPSCINGPIREQENERIATEDVVRRPEVIPEEEMLTPEIEKHEGDHDVLSLSDESCDNAVEAAEEMEDQLPETIAAKYVDASAPTLATLTEEEMPLESPPENLMQTATTCLIPVPVYECSNREWGTPRMEQQWVNVEQNEVGMTPVAIEHPPDYLGQIVEATSSEPIEEASSADTKQEESSPEGNVLPDLLHTEQNPVPLISVSPDTNQQSDSTGEDRSSEEKVIEFPEVRKRYSNDDLKDAPTPRGNSIEEKRRIDKSRRRKGMYIQWPTINKHGVIETPEWEDDNTSHANGDGSGKRKGNGGIHLDFSKLKINPGQELDTSSTPQSLSCMSPEDVRSPGSLYSSYDPATPDSESGGKPVWPKVASTTSSRRASLSLQSSEEKDDVPATHKPSASHKPSQHRNIMFLRSDSISDNENDQRNRDRASPSPAPSDHDYKRYSKRPLRGPYGQMLEAEMKKPGRMHYDEILEDLKSTESLNTLSPPNRGRGGAGNLSFDETANRQQKNSRSRKGSAHLPVPAHTRAASTPSQMENTTTTASINSINPQHKRCQSTLDTTALDRIPSTGHLKESSSSKKLSVDRERSPKRASSEALEIKHQNAKRSASTASDKQPKRSLDEMRLSSRTPSDRSMTESTKSSTNLLPTPELLAELLKGSSERLVAEQRQQMFADTRTHIVQEIFQNEQSYVEDLQTVIVKYLNVLKMPEYAGMIDSKTVDEIFYMVPEILSIHERFLNELRRRLEVWEPQQMVGDAFVEAFSKADVLETYTLFVNNCNRAKDAIRMTCQARPSFSRFLQNTSREHKGKLTLDNLLIKPVQKFPNYELLFRRLIKHTDVDHPDQKPLQDALKLAHDILLHINAKKKEGHENGQREAALRELEGVIEGVNDLVAADRQFIALDVVSMPNGQGARKERGFFLFSDLLVITSIKRRSGTIRKPNTTVCPGSVASTLDTNKYKFLMKIPLDNTEIVKSKDESVRKIMNEIDQLVDDCNKVQQISKIMSSLRYPHQHLEETLKDLHREIDSQLKELKSQDNQLNMLELTFQLPNGIQNITVAFSKPESRSQWEENFNDAKQKLAASLERHPIPEFLTSIPIRKTRAGLQFTCAAPTLSNQKDVWVCNSDGYVGQVCVLSLFPEPTVTSCNGVCNARILCVASVPACNDQADQRSVSSSSNSETPRSSRNSNSSTSTDKKPTKSKSDGGSDIKLDSSSSSSDSEIDNQERVPSPTPVVSTHHQHQDSSDDTDGLQSTMWLGTEDGCIHVYNCTDNIRIKKNKIKIQHVSAVYSILYLDNRVFVSLANGDICVYLRDSSGWNTTSPHCLPIGSVTSPVNRLLNVQGKLWCSIQGIIKVLDTKTLQVENQIQISSDSKPITNMAVSSHYVWISIQNSALIKCFHSNSYEQIFEVNLGPSVNKMLCNCDDIIRQHKAACLRVTSLLACRDLIWIGTSAGVLLTIPSQGHTKGSGSSTNNTPVVTGIPHGHTGHVRFLTFVETESAANGSGGSDDNGSIGYGTTERKNKRNSTHNKSKNETGNVLIISGGDGYEDFRSSGANTMSEIAGREDSTNHLLLWQM